ncbi:hypothetical protein C8Q76DRAFT_802574 [Earliella scabrosa]|nr:hypothetical protein C8Q76DRAFT_802574 [Earliella scabrosa]
MTPSTLDQVRNPATFYMFYVTRLMTVSSWTLSLLEIVNTLPDEITLLWPARLNIMKIIFFVNKYSPLLDTNLMLSMSMWTYDTEALAYIYVAGITFSEYILVGRTMALWGFNKIVMMTLIAGAIVLPGLAFSSAQQALSITEYPARDVLAVLGCNPTTQDHIAWPAWVCVMIAEIYIVGMTLIKRYSDPIAMENTPRCMLFKTMYRDGTLYFAIVLGSSTTNRASGTPLSHPLLTATFLDTKWSRSPRHQTPINLAD